MRAVINRTPAASSQGLTEPSTSTKCAASLSSVLCCVLNVWSCVAGSAERSGAAAGEAPHCSRRRRKSPRCSRARRRSVWLPDVSSALAPLQMLRDTACAAAASHRAAATIGAVASGRHTSAAHSRRCRCCATLPAPPPQVERGCSAAPRLLAATPPRPCSCLPAA